MATKPASGTPLNTGSPLYTGLTAAWGFLEGSGTPLDSVGGVAATFSTSPAPSWGSDSEGPKILFGSDGAELDIATPINLVGGTSWTVAWASKQTAANDQGMVFGHSGNTDFFIWFEGGTPQITTRFNQTPGGPNLTGGDGLTSGNCTTRNDWCLTAAFSSGTIDFAYYLNGTHLATHSVSEQAGTDTINAIGNGYNRGSGLSLIGEMEYFYVWNGTALSSGNVATLAANPYTIFGAGASSAALDGAQFLDVHGIAGPVAAGWI
jgi:Concanavalin A-like lectin/glucanases superfamily